MERVSVNQLLNDINQYVPITLALNEEFYKWLDQTPVEHSTLAKNLGLKYDQFRYKVKKKTFTWDEIATLLNHWKEALI